MQKALATFALFALAASAQTPAPAPTPSELLQRGIFAQETSGDLDAAIKSYRQIVDSHPQQRELGAQAQYRLAMALLAKGDTNGAAQEIQRLGWDYPDYKNLVTAAGRSSIATGIVVQPAFHATYNGENKTFFFSQVPPGPMSPAELQAIAESRDRTIFYNSVSGHEALFDFGKTETITGRVIQVSLMNPYSFISIAPSSQSHLGPLVQAFVASTNALSRAGWTRDNGPKLGDQITITGAPAVDGSSTLQATQVTYRDQVLFSRPNGPLPQNAMGAYEK
ncbi:MAG TPA: DUF6152 family protein [Bryobacteraceae bacterium]|jgi:tetratricopeptide (TPR) repeat protein